MKHHPRPILASLVLLLCIGCSKQHEVLLPDQRNREWVLPHGESVKFSHERPLLGSDHYKYLDVGINGGPSKRYSFAGGHSGYNRVDLVLDPSQTKIWLTDSDNGSSAFLDLATGKFMDEGLAPTIPPGSRTVLPR